MNNVYLLGMIISMLIYIGISLVVSRKVKTANDYYVAGKNAPTFLIAGSLIASYAATGLFMGDGAESYSGLFSPIVFLAVMQTVGYVIGAVFFGRYLKRSGVNTIPQFFEKRFRSDAVKKLAAITALITMSVYLISVTQGIGTLMSLVTPLDYNICVFVALAVFTLVTVISGSRGVLITDTLMATVFTLSIIIGSIVIGNRTGGWFTSIATIAKDVNLKELLSWSGKIGYMYNSGWMNILWAFIYGIVWMSVCAVSPWQSSRYIMAKNEKTVIKSAIPAIIGVSLIEFLVCMFAVFINLENPNIENSSHAIVWAAMNMLPTLLGVVFLTGILAAGISSATTFLSLIGSVVANDLMPKNDNKIKAGKIVMVIVSSIALVLTLTNPPQIFWIVYLGGSIIAASWMPTTLASILSKRLTKYGAFAGMLSGFVTCFGLKLYTNLAGKTLPAYLDPSFVGIVVNILAMIVVSSFTKLTNEEIAARNELFVVPETEKDKKSIVSTLTALKSIVCIGIIVSIMLLVLWAIPYVSSM